MNPTLKALLAALLAAGALVPTGIAIDGGATTFSGGGAPCCRTAIN